jgi:hypothetical protein
MRVEVYFNLHKKTFSVRSAKSGKVLLHTDEVHIENPEFVVRQSGRNRVLSEGRKNVHAFVRGDATFFRYTNRPMLDTLTYNPYKYASFVDKQTEEPVYKASRAWLTVTDKIPTIQAEGVQTCL